MKSYSIQGKHIELDDTKIYCDFYLTGGKQNLEKIDLEGMLSAMEAGQLPVDDGLRDFMQYLQRWTDDAPRKRMYRKMRADGYNVLSAEQFFDHEGGDVMINSLENTGKFADYFLQQMYGKQ